MATAHPPHEAKLMADRLTSSLDAVTDLLAAARDAEAFVAAIEANGVVWREILELAPVLGWRVPDEMARFSLSMAARAGRGISDHEVETLMRLNRALAVEISASRAC
ncbi:MAG: hypothetical protein HQL38_10600 [Alphaproteobacteria bacterium]|nr:hypothetical protein [Alphaproteobacteria bacterium]